jgi:hypothetical protein
MGLEGIFVRNRGGNVRVVVTLILGDLLFLAVIAVPTHDRNRRRWPGLTRGDPTEWWSSRRRRGRRS